MRYCDYNEHRDFNILQGQTLSDIKIDKENEEIIFTTTDNKKYVMFHERDCCESVEIEEIIGDINDLLNTPVVLAEVITNEEKPKDKYDESFLWTFYKLVTAKGMVTFRWYGCSNGYYSERVDFSEIQGD